MHLGWSHQNPFFIHSTYFGAKSANQSQKNSKGPCEDAGGNRYKSIYIHSKKKKKVLYQQPERPLSKEEATAPKPP
jgi:hypothetical protein